MKDETALYQAEDADALIIQPLDAVTLIYHQRSGITHIVAEPTPQILAAMAEIGDAVSAGSTGDAGAANAGLSAQAITQRLAQDFDLGDDTAQAQAIVADRLEELAQLGLVTRHA